MRDLNRYSGGHIAPFGNQAAAFFEIDPDLIAFLEEKRYLIFA